MRMERVFGVVDVLHLTRAIIAIGMYLAKGIIRSTVWIGTKRHRIASGQESVCRVKRSGSTEREERMVGSIRGGMAHRAVSYVGIDGKGGWEPV